jgi:hypothetical protein
VSALLLFVDLQAIEPKLWQNSMNKKRLEALLQKTFSRFFVAYCCLFLVLFAIWLNSLDTLGCPKF